jgi:hypothetical protein
METKNQTKDRAYMIGNFYVKNPQYSIEKGEYEYQLTTNIDDAFLMTNEAAKFLHKCNGEGQIRIINIIQK